MKRIITFILIILFSIPLMVYAEDNVTGGDGGTDDGVYGKAYYRSSEWLYKVSVYVGLSDTADTNSNLNTAFKMVGDVQLYVKPSSFTMPSNVMYGSGSKVDYLNGQGLGTTSPQIITDDCPPTPIVNHGSISSVKSYFGDTHTLMLFIDAFATQKGTTREGLVNGINFNIEGVSKTYPADEILPVKVDGKYQNRVPWVIIYEPVTIAYLKDGVTKLAFTATEYALAQKAGYFDFGYGDDGEFIKGMTHSDLPNSLVLEQSWFGYPVTAPLADGVKWSDDRIIQGGGWGMRLLKANGESTAVNNAVYDETYRIDTDVITAFRIYATSGDITPDKRHTVLDTREDAFNNPVDNKAYVTISANGQSTTVPIVLKNGTSEYAWLKWHTPSTVGEVDVSVSISGNSSAKLEGGARSATIKAEVVDLDLNPPPDPRPHDRNDGFTLVSLPNVAEKTTANWGIYGASYHQKLVWHEDLQWEVTDRYWGVTGSSYVKIGRHWGITCDAWVPNYDEYGTEIPGGYWWYGYGWIDDYGWVDNYGWIDTYGWVDHGYWENHGWWDYTYAGYSATLTSDMNLVPDTYCPTAIAVGSDYEMKSAYGVNVDVNAGYTTNAPSNAITPPQNAITYFPEFAYETYWRLLDKVNANTFQFKTNIHSSWNNRVHFTPLWYPDIDYPVYGEVIDMWTPDGMLRKTVNDKVIINGNMYDDWHIGPSENK